LLKLRVLVAAAAVAATSVLIPGTAQAGTPGCGALTLASVNSSSITVTQQPLCAGTSGYVILWLNVPISNGWTGAGWSTDVPATATTAGEYVYTCYGTAHNTFQLQGFTGSGVNTLFTDNCGPVEP
jgi:hypothetical protein